MALDEALVEQDPAEGDDQREDNEEVAGEGGARFAEMRSNGMTRSECDERGAEGGDDKSEPASCVHALVGEESGGGGEQDGHGANHERCVRDGGERESGRIG